MTPFERYCADNLVSTTNQFILEQEAGKFLVSLLEDDDSRQINFNIDEVIEECSSYSKGDTIWGHIENLTLATVNVDGVQVGHWDYATAAQLKIKAQAAVQAYNDYIGKMPAVNFAKM